MEFVTVAGLAALGGGLCLVIGRPPQVTHALDSFVASASG